MRTVSVQDSFLIFSHTLWKVFYICSARSWHVLQPIFRDSLSYDLISLLVFVHYLPVLLFYSWLVYALCFVAWLKIFSLVQSLHSQWMQYIKHRIKRFDTYFPCGLENYMLKHIINWLNLVIYCRNKELRTV